MMRVGPLLVAVLVLVGCGGVKPQRAQVDQPAPVEKAPLLPDKPPQLEPETPASPVPPAPPTPPDKEEVPVWAKAQVLTETPRAGQRIEFLYEYHNMGERPITLSFPTGQTVELVVQRDGTEVWRFSRMGFFTQQLTELSLGAGQSKSWHLAWDGRDMSGRPVPSGRYTATLSLTAGSAEWSEIAVAFDVG